MKTTRDPALKLPNAPASNLNRKPKSRVLVWLKRIGMGLVFGVLMLSMVGSAYQALASQIDTRSIPSTGQMVDVGGYPLHISCTGANVKGSPTVILETGLGGTSSSWTWVQPEIAKTTRVCACCLPYR